MDCWDDIKSIRAGRTVVTCGPLVHLPIINHREWWSYSGIVISLFRHLMKGGRLQGNLKWYVSFYFLPHSARATRSTLSSNSPIPRAAFVVHAHYSCSSHVAIRIKMPECMYRSNSECWQLCSAICYVLWMCMEMRLNGGMIYKLPAKWDRVELNKWILFLIRSVKVRRDAKLYTFSTTVLKSTAQ